MCHCFYGLDPCIKPLINTNRGTRRQQTKSLTKTLQIKWNRAKKRNKTNPTRKKSGTSWCNLATFFSPPVQFFVLKTGADIDAVMTLVRPEIHTMSG